MRIVHLKHQWVLEKFGKSQLLAALIFTYFALMFGNCYGNTRKFQEHEVQWRKCYPEGEINQAIARRNKLMILFSFLSLSIMEAAIYASIFRFIYKHHLSMRLILKEDEVKRRHQKNALDVFGHFAHFLVEVTQVMLWMVAISTYDGSLNRYGLGVYVFQSGIISFALISISPTLRHVCKNLLLANWVTLILIALTSVVLILYVSLMKALTKF